MPGRLTYPTRNVPTKNGGEVLWEKGIISRSRGGAGVRFKCAWPGCPEPKREGEADARRAMQQGEDFRALHADCYQAVKKLPDAERFVTVHRPRLSGEIALPKDTVILLDVRGENVHQTGIKCRKCYDLEIDNVKFLDFSNIARYVKVCLFKAAVLVCTIEAEDKAAWFRVWPFLSWLFYWDELCSDCVLARGSLKKFVGVKVAPSKTKVEFPADMNAPVIYHHTCGHSRPVNRDNASNNWGVAGGPCPDCRQKAIRETLRKLKTGGLAALNEGSSDNRRKNETAKKKRPGPEKGQYAFITWGNMEEAFERLGALPTKAKIAKELGVTESGIEKWLKREKVGWKDVQLRFLKTTLVLPKD